MPPVIKTARTLLSITAIQTEGTRLLLGLTAFHIKHQRESSLEFTLTVLKIKRMDNKMVTKEILDRMIEFSRQLEELVVKWEELVKELEK